MCEAEQEEILQKVAFSLLCAIARMRNTGVDLVVEVSLHFEDTREGSLRMIKNTVKKFVAAECAEEFGLDWVPGRRRSVQPSDTRTLRFWVKNDMPRLSL